MPRTTKQNEALRAGSQSRILAAALRLFAEHGYAQTSVRMIAQEAGVAQGLLYNYFAGKEALLRAIFAQSMADVRASFAAAEAAAPGERVERLVRASFAIVRESLPFWRLSYGVRAQPAVLAGLGDALPSWLATIRDTVERYVRDAGAPDPRVEGEILFALIDGVAQHYALQPTTYPLEALETAIVGRYRQLVVAWRAEANGA
jgi:AcrR family transcriptional regulator